MSFYENRNKINCNIYVFSHSLKSTIDEIWHSSIFCSIFWDSLMVAWRLFYHWSDFISGNISSFLVKYEWWHVDCLGGADAGGMLLPLLMTVFSLSSLFYLRLLIFYQEGIILGLRNFECNPNANKKKHVLYNCIN